MELRVTDTILDLHRVRFCDNEKGGHWLYDDDGNATVRVIYAYCVMFCFGLF